MKVCLDLGPQAALMSSCVQLNELLLPGEWKDFVVYTRDMTVCPWLEKSIVCEVFMYGGGCLRCVYDFSDLLWACLEERCDGSWDEQVTQSVSSWASCGTETIRQPLQWSISVPPAPGKAVKSVAKYTVMQNKREIQMSSASLSKGQKVSSCSVWALLRLSSSYRHKTLHLSCKQTQRLLECVRSFRRVDNHRFLLSSIRFSTYELSARLRPPGPLPRL